MEQPARSATPADPLACSVAAAVEDGMSPRFGAHVSTSGGVSRAFADGERLGCDTIQIFTANPTQWRARPLTPEHIRAFHEEQQRTGIGPVAAHASYLINLANPDLNVLAPSRERLREELRGADQLRIPWVVLHPGSSMKASQQAGIEQIARELDACYRELGDVSVEVLLEITAGQGTSIGHTFRQLRDIISRSRTAERLGICLDTAHAHAAGYDVSPAGLAGIIDEMEREQLSSRLKLIHVNDTVKDRGSRMDRHAFIGMGQIGQEGFAAIVRHPWLREFPMILELPPGPNGAHIRENLAVLRHLARGQK